MANQTRGWQSGRSLLDCHKYMLENQIGCDVTCLFPTPEGSTLQIPAHRYVLMSRSPVFEAMLSGDFLESSNEVTIEDIEPDIFRETLRYMYYDGPCLSGHNVLHVLFAANKYLLDGLVERCKTFLKDEMCADNVCTILSHSLRYDEKQLVDECMSFITLNTGEVVQSSDFLQMSQDALHLLLSNDHFGLESEIDLFRACLGWSESQQQTEESTPLRDILGKCLFQIRFSLMSSEEILRISEDYPGVLNDKEVIWFLYQCIMNEESQQMPTNISKFNLDDRVLKNGMSAMRFDTVSDGAWVCDWLGPDRIQFKVDRPVIFKGITLFGGHNAGDRYSVSMTLLKAKLTLSKIKAEFKSDGTKEPVKILVSEPCRLERNVTYTIETVRRGPNTFYGMSGKPNVRLGGVTITYMTYSGQNNNTTVETGQIPQVLFAKENGLQTFNQRQ